MQAFQGQKDPHRLFWCPRCGTIKIGDDVAQPWLVVRAATAKNMLNRVGPPGDEYYQVNSRQFDQIGLNECLMLPDQRIALAALDAQR